VKNPENIDVLSGVLRPEYKIKAALNGERALKIAMGMPKPDIILLDIMMPDMDGYEVCQRLKSNLDTKRIPIIFITAKNHEEDEKKGLQLGAVDYITKPISPAIVLTCVQTHLALYDQNRALEQKVNERTAELQNTRLEIVRRLGRAGEFKDNETGMHVIRMSNYSYALAKAIGLSESDAGMILTASPMHDIGKIGTPDKVLLKPDKLDDNEWNVMQQHPAMGAEIIGQHDSEMLNMAREIASFHHEKYNGRGYPNGLKGNDIPLAARIVAIADVFDALTTERPYKKAWTTEDAINLLKEEAGEHFDPDLVDKFVEIMPQILEMKEKYAEKNSH